LGGADCLSSIYIEYDFLIKSTIFEDFQAQFIGLWRGTIEFSLADCLSSLPTLRETVGLTH
jgi:hypothetical protein